MNNDVNNSGGNSPDAFMKMNPADRKALVELINTRLAPRRTINPHFSSYQLKHIFEPKVPGGYISNGEMKGAMLHCGYAAANTDEINWVFNVSSRSPALVEWKQSFRMR